MKIKHLLSLTIVLQFVALAQQEIPSLNAFRKDDNSKYTSIGNFGITITNFGTYGHGFALWPQQPSGEYPKGSGIEHIFDGGLYVGGFISNDSLGSGKAVRWMLLLFPLEVVDLNLQMQKNQEWWKDHHF